jgi:hypothetical protein
MEIKARRSTWLELAVAPLWRLGQARVRVHALGGGHAGCLAITLDERWLCANDGRLTVFKCRDALTRFLGLLRIDHMEDGEACESPTPCGRQDVQCMRLGRRGLCVCADGRPRGGLSGGQSQTIWPRVSLSSDAMR